MPTKYALTVKMEEIITKNPYIFQVSGTLDQIIAQLAQYARERAFPLPNETWTLDEDGHEDVNATEPLHRDCTPEEVLDWSRVVLDIPNGANIMIERSRPLTEAEKNFYTLSKAGLNHTEKIMYHDYEIEKLGHIEITESAEIMRIWLSSPAADEDAVAGIAVQRFSNPEKLEHIDYNGDFWRWELWLSDALGLPEGAVEILLDGKDFSSDDVEVIVSVTNV